MKLLLPQLLLKVLLGSILGIAAILAGFFIFFFNKIYPGVSVGNISLSGKTKDQAKALLIQTIQQRSQPLTFDMGGQSYSITIPPYQDNQINSLVNQAFEFGHSKIYYSAQSLQLSTPDLDSQLNNISQTVKKPPVDSTLVLNDSEVSTTPSSDGSGLDTDTLKGYITTYINTGSLPSTQLPIKVTHPQITEQNNLEIKQTLDKLKISPLKLAFKDFSTTLDLPTILGMIDINNSESSLFASNVPGLSFNVSSVTLGNDDYSDRKLTLDATKLQSYLTTLSTQINQNVREPVFDYDGKKVNNFQPPQEGRVLDINQTAQIIQDRLNSGNLADVSLPVATVEPKNQLVNQLGIKDLLGEGVSHFRGSPSDRIFNLELAASRVSGSLVAPGQTFSFDNSVGPIDGAHGYHQGYVIESGKTVLDDGGGVCQDPTTLFRAVLNAGLPVVSRTAHAYRVYYYEEGFPPGEDATIYSPSVDFKFKNDTQNYILVEASWDNSTDTLYYDLWGTSDGRVSQVSTPVILSSTPAPHDEHQPDPTKPKGTSTQIDFASGGASVVFSRTVTRDGQTLIHDTYHSNYTPQANVYLDGTL